MQENSYYAPITKYYERTTTESVAWEAKITKDGRIPFSSVAPHQEVNLLKEVLGFKIPDNGIGQKPFDGFVLYKPKAVIIAIYYEPRDVELYEIPIRAWVQECYTSKHKSLKKQRAAEIGTRIFL